MISIDYSYKKEGEFIWPVAMRSRFKEVGGWHTLTDEQRAKHGWYPIDYTGKEYDPATEDRLFVSQELVGEVFKVVYAVRDLTIDELSTRLLEDVTTSTQTRLDDFAQTRAYDSMLSACTYVTSSVVRLKAEGQYCVDSRDSTWETLYTILGEVKAGTRPMPGSFADIESELPSLEWPI